MSSITLAIPPAIVQEARAMAKRNDTTLNGMIRSYLESMVSESVNGTRDDPAAEFARLVAKKGVRRSRPYRFRRADAYEGEVLA